MPRALSVHACEPEAFLAAARESSPDPDEFPLEDVGPFDSDRYAADLAEILECGAAFDEAETLLLEWLLALHAGGNDTWLPGEDLPGGTTMLLDADGVVELHEAVADVDPERLYPRVADAAEQLEEEVGFAEYLHQYLDLVHTCAEEGAGLTARVWEATE